MPRRNRFIEHPTRNELREYAAACRSSKTPKDPNIRKKTSLSGEPTIQGSDKVQYSAKNVESQTIEQALKYALNESKREAHKKTWSYYLASFFYQETKKATAPKCPKAKVERYPLDEKHHDHFKGATRRARELYRMHCFEALPTIMENVDEVEEHEAHSSPIEDQQKPRNHLDEDQGMNIVTKPEKHDDVCPYPETLLF